jgi:hypothetical protein
MSNPNPAHNPTDGLGSACYVQVTGTNITNCASGGLTVATEATANDTRGLNGQGYGAVQGDKNGVAHNSYRPVAQYALQLSLSGKTYGGTVYASTCQLTTVLKDVADNTYASWVGSPTYKSYNDPQAGSPAWYKPSRGTAGPNTYNDNVASVSATGLITGLAVGQAVIEVQFPTFDFVASSLDPEPTQASGDPVQMIFRQILVTVVS